MYLWNVEISILGVAMVLGKPVSDIDQRRIAIRVEGITKNFGHLQALRGVNLGIYSHEILALIGDNGAGKSTLIKVICGAHQQDSGEIYFWGKKTNVQSIQHAYDLGVFTVYQDLSLAPELTVPENMFLGREILLPGLLGSLGMLDRKKMRTQTQQSLANLGIGLKQISTRTSNLSGGERQAVAVARAVTWATTALIMDEPTAALGAKQTSIVYDTLRSAANNGLAVLVISHDIPKMLEVADRIAIMRHGEVIETTEVKKVSLQRVINLMLAGKGE